MKVKRKTLIIVMSIIGMFILVIGYALINFTPVGTFIQLASLGDRIDEFDEKSERDYDVLHYDIFVDVYPEVKEIIGKTTLKLVCSQPNLTLDFYDNMNIGLLTINSIPAKYDQDDDLLIINLSQSDSDTNYITIEYKGTPERKGLGSFNFDEYKGSPFVYSLNEPFYASTWFPCNDIPNDKATFDIKIASDSALVSLSNGILVEEYESNGRRIFHWQTKYETSTYLVCIYSAEYVNFSQEYISLDQTDTMEIDYYVTADLLDDAKIEFKEHPQYLNVLASIFGEYPFIDEKYAVAQFLWPYGAMEHQTITGIGVNFISGRKFSRDILIHELAHHWWGNAVGPESWKDIWLNEGFSSYSEALYHEKVSGEDALTSTMISKRGEFANTQLYDPEGNIFTKTVYDKGAWVLHMLRYELGDKVFFEILRRYFEKYKYKNASTENFKEVCEEISGKNLDTFFDQWVYKGKGIIEAQYRWTQTQESDGNYKVELKLNQVQKLYHYYQFPIDVEFILDDQKSVTKKFMVKEKESSFDFVSKSKISFVKIDPGSRLLADIYEIRN